MVNLHTTFNGSIPEYYDRYLGTAQFDPFGRELAALVPHDPGGDVLEIACGTGLVTKRLRERLVPERRLVASDLSPAMIDFARTKLAAMKGIEWREADMTKLPFRDGEFAAVVCALGIMFVPDKPAAALEMRRVLRSGGMLVLTTWDRLEENTAARIYAETIESLFPGDAELRFRLPWEMHDEAKIAKLLGDAGFADVRIQKRRLPITGEPRDIATGQVRGTPRGALLEKRGLSMGDAIDKVAAALEKNRASLRGQALLIEANA